MMLIFFLNCTHSTFTPPSINIDMVEFSQSTFDMGLPDLEVGPYGNSWKETAQPLHEVSLPTFIIDKTEVTIAQYLLFLNSIESEVSGSAYAHYHPLQPIIWKDDNFISTQQETQLPMNYVSYYDALAFCSWRGSSLPTEAMWERAAKGADRENPRSYPWLEGGPNCQKAAYYTDNTLCAPAPKAVDTYPDGATPEGILGMGGNVSEWVWDWYARYEETSIHNPRGPDTGTYKIVRGGGFRETKDALRTTDRVVANPLSRSEGIGFRCAHEVPQ